MKYIYLIISTLLIAFNLNAQINVIKYEVEDLANLSKCGFLSKDNDKLIKDKESYYLYLHTSNRFDDPIIINTGNLEQALLTFKDIQDKWFTLNQGDQFIIDDAYFVVIDDNNRHEKVLSIKGKNSAGFATLYLKSIQACYLVLRNISINMSRIDSTRVDNQITPEEQQDKQIPTQVEQPTTQNSPEIVNGNYSIADELLKLNQLKEMGVLTEEEFKTLKARIISK